MRDPARIDEMLNLLREVWQLEPDLRLGQLVFNAARMREPELQDVYSIEDGALRKGLMRYLELKRRPSGLKLYKAIVSSNDDGRRVTVEVESLDEAMHKLESQYGEGAVYDLHNEEEADRAR